jgi:hypothetical protein
VPELSALFRAVLDETNATAAGNAIGNRGATSVATGLQGNSVLTKLDLDSARLRMHVSITVFDLILI